MPLCPFVSETIPKTNEEKGISANGKKTHIFETVLSLIPETIANKITEITIEAKETMNKTKETIEKERFFSFDADFLDVSVKK